MGYKIITERSHLYAPNINVLFTVEFCNAIDIDTLREAIKKVFKKYPILTASIMFEENGNAYFHLGDNRDPEIYVKTIIDSENWISTVEYEQQKPFNLSQGPLIRFTSVIAGEKMYLVMCAHHIIADGLSCVRILQDIMAYIQKPDTYIKVQQVKLLEDMNIYDKEKLTFPVRLLVHGLNKYWRKSAQSFSENEYSIMRQSFWNHYSHTINIAELGKAQTDKLIEHCKKHNVTVNSLLLSALLHSAQLIDKRNKKAGIAVSIHTEETNVGNYASGISINYLYNKRKSIWENASKVQALVKMKQSNIKRKNFYLTFLKALDANLIDSIYFSMYGEFNNKATNQLRKILGYVENPISLGTSNLGKQELSSALGIKAAYFIPPLIANTDKIVGTITTDSGLKIVYQYVNQVNAEQNRLIFEAWEKELHEL